MKIFLTCLSLLTTTSTLASQPQAVAWNDISRSSASFMPEKTWKKSSTSSLSRGSTRRLSWWQIKRMKPVQFPEAPKSVEYPDQNLVQLLPKNFDASTKTEDVGVKAGDQFLQNVFNLPQVRNSTLGQTATRVEKAMKTEVHLGGKKSKPGHPESLEKSVDHKLKFQVQALQAQTKVEYSGWTNASVKLDARTHETGFEISEKVGNKDLVLNHTKAPDEDRSSVGIRWNW